MRRHQRDFRRQLTFECLDDRRCNLILHGKHVLEIAIETLGPELIPVSGPIISTVILNRLFCLCTLPSTTVPTLRACPI